MIFLLDSNGARWQLTDSAATVDYVMAQLQKAKWLPVIGPRGSGAPAPGYLRSSAVVAVVDQRGEHV